MKKRSLCILSAIFLIAVTAAVLFAVNVSADTYNLWIGGERVTSSNLSGAGWRYEPDSNTLVLNDFGLATKGYNLGKPSISGYDDGRTWAYAVIYSNGGDINIRAEGKESYIGDPNFASRLYEEVKSDGTHAVYCGIYSGGGKITISGSARLTVGAHYRAIYAGNGGELTFDNARDVETITYSGDTLHASHITLKGGSYVNAEAGHAGAGVSSVNIYASNTVNIYDSSRLCSSYELSKDYNGSFKGIYCASNKSGSGINVYGGEIRSFIYPAGYEIGSGTLYAFDAKTLNISGDGLAYGEIFNWFDSSKYYVNSVVYGYNGGGAKVNFNGPGVLNLKMWLKKPEGSSLTQQLRPDNISFAENLLHKTSVPSTSSDCYEEITAYTCDGIFLSTSRGNQYWSYNEKNLYPSNYGNYYGSGDLKNAVLELKDLVTKSPSVSKLVVTENCEHVVNPNVSEGMEIPEMTVKSGATLTLKFDKGKDYTFTKPIYLEGGTLKINVGYYVGLNSGLIKGLDVRGNGTVIFGGGNVSGDVEKTVKVVMNNESGWVGNIDIPDYDNAVDENGNTVHKFAYKAETEYDYFSRVCIIGELEERNFLRFEGAFRKAENGDKMLYIWTDRADRPHRIDAYKEPGDWDNAQTLSLKYGTNTFAPGTPFDMKDSGVVAARADDNVVLSPLAGDNPTDLQRSFVSWVKWYVSLDGGENFELVQKTQGPTIGNSGTSDTIRFEYVVPEVTEAQNGYIYRCEICYYDVIELDRFYYYYDATLYVDTPQLNEPERYVDGQPARFEMTHGTAPDGVTFNYRWELSRSGGISWETVQDGDSAVYETAAVTDEMEGWQIRVVYSIYANGKKLSEGTTDPATIDTIGKAPVITKHPESIVHRLQEVIDDNFPPDPNKVIIAIDTYYAFSVEAEGEDLHYQWQRSYDNGRTFSDLQDEDEARTKAWYKVEAGSTLQYRCIVYNDFGSVISNAATTRTLYSPTVSNPQDMTVLEHNDAVFRVEITQGIPYGTDVVWQVSKDGQTIGDITEADGTVNVYSEVVDGNIRWYTTLTVSNVSQDMSGYMYRCIVKNQPNSEDYNGLRRSEPATLTVKYNCSVDGHIFDDGTVTKEPTCTESGSSRYVCSACDYVEARYIAPLGHDWKPATCRSVKTCLREGCGISEGNFDYTNHIGELVWNTEDWGDADGHMSRWSCCGIIEYPYERHTFVDGVCPTCGYVCIHPITRAADCHTEGTCEICGLKTADIDPNNHDLSLGTTIRDQKDPTCTEEGYTGDVVCWECHGVITAGTVIPANGHDITMAANCKYPAWCYACKQYVGDTDPDNHEQEWSKHYENITETTHEAHWSCCDTVKTEPHDLDEDGVCRDCHYGCVHTGGEANCVEQAYCEKCGEPYGDLDPDNHVYTMFYPDGDDTHTERCKCGKIISGPEPHTWENGECTVCYTQHQNHVESDLIVDAEPTYGREGWGHKDCTVCGMLLEVRDFEAVTSERFPVAHNCSFGNDLSMLYAIPKSVLSGCENIRLIVEKENYDGNTPAGSISKILYPTEYSINGVDYYRFDYTEVRAKELGDTLTATLAFTLDGVDYSGEVDTYSLMQYATERLAASNDTSFKALLVDLLNYGTAAQNYFGYRTDALVNAGLTDEQRALSRQSYDPLNVITDSGDGEYPEAITRKNIMFHNRIELLIATSLGEDSDLGGIALRIRYTNRAGEPVEKLIDSAKFVYRSDVGGYTAYFDGLNASELRTELELTLIKDGEPISRTVRYSFDVYANSRLASSTSESYKELLSKTLIYSDSAKDYFTSANQSQTTN